MRFLQTSDWHLGKIFHELSLIKDQEVFLEQIYQELENSRKEKKQYSALLIPGDIYDRAIPSAEAVEVFSNFINKVIINFSDLHIFLIPGNHDSASRLSYFQQILEIHNVHICTNTNKIETPIVLKKENEEICVYQIPFLYPLSITKEGKFLRSQQELYEEACNQIQENHKKIYKDLPSILCAHLFTISSKVNSSERSYIGTAEQVSAEIFEKFTYTALGHIHKYQPCGKENRIFYSGAPLAYDFNDSQDTYMLSVTIKGTEQPLVEKIPFKPLHKVVNLEGSFHEFYGETANKKQIDENKNNYVKITCTDSVIIQGAMNLLKTNYPYCLSFVPKQRQSDNKISSIEERKNIITSKSSKDIFEKFIDDAYGSPEYRIKLKNDEKKMFEKEEKIFIEKTKNISWQE